MLVPIFKTILPKTLLKWTTPQIKLATKFKTKSSNISEGKTITTTTSVCSTAAVTRTTTTTPTIRSQYSQSFYLAILIITQICLNTVIKSLSSLMNDIRTKSRYLKTTTTASNSTLFSSSVSSPSSSSSSSSASIDTKHFNNNYKNNHRTYNNSSKSNKVFLHYTPRDPRLRILNNQTQSFPISFNKHLDLLESDSELKINEDLSNYGELIGGGGYNNKTNNPRCIDCHKHNNKNNNKTSNFANNFDLCTKSVSDRNRESVIDIVIGKSDTSDQDKNHRVNCKQLFEGQPQEEKEEGEGEEKVVKIFNSFIEGSQNNHWSIAIKEIVYVSVCI